MPSPPPPSDITLSEEAQLPLPSSWSLLPTPTGSRLYISPAGESFSEHPLIASARSSLASVKAPAGWRVHRAEGEGGEGEVYYSHAEEGVAMWDHPLLRGSVEVGWREEEEGRRRDGEREGEGGGGATRLAPSTVPLADRDPSFSPTPTHPPSSPLVYPLPPNSSVFPGRGEGGGDGGRGRREGLARDW